MIAKLKTLLPVLVAITCIYGFIYVVIQQVYRQNANDPQIQISEDIASALNAGQNPTKILPQFKADVSKSLNTVVTIFNDDKKPVSSTATLDNTIPVPPSGVFDYVQKNGQTRITWQPQDGVRLAMVMTQTKSGYVLAARSLREVEQRESQLTLQVFMAWFATITAALIAALLINPNPKKR